MKKSMLCSVLFSLFPFHAEAAPPRSLPAMLQALETLQAEAVDPSRFTRSNCQAFLEGWNGLLRATRWRSIAPASGSEQGLLRARGSAMLRSLFQTRLQIRERALAERSCEPAARQLMTALRIAEELLGGWLVQNGAIRQVAEDDLRAFHPSLTLANPKFASWSFQPGDVILDRGGSYISAMIARIGDNEALFSHLAMVGQDSRGKLYLVEISTEDMKKIVPLEEWLGENADPRMAVYRHKDRALAQRAGRMIHDHFEERIRNEGRIRYDFHMDDSDHHTLFCSEVILLAYKLASRGRMLYPEHRTTVKKFSGNDFEMLRRLGINGKDFPAPVDIDTDSRFELVAEFREYRQLEEIRMNDAILSSIYEWLNSKGYRFGGHPGMFVLSGGVAAASRILPRMPVPGNMPRGAIDIAIRIEKLGAAIGQRLQPAMEELRRRSPFPMDFWEMKQFLERLRLADCHLFQRSIGAFASRDRGNNLSREISIHYFISSPDACPARGQSFD